MFTHKKFDVEIVRQIEPQHLDWPKRGEAQTDYGLGCNREYVDLRGLSWSEAKRVYEVESTLIRRVETSSDPVAELEDISEQCYENDDVVIYGLDIGVASTVVALSAAGCVPCVSCNGGTFGDHHYEKHPLVVFYARREFVDLLLARAEDAGVGLELALGGSLMVYSDEIQRMRRFAEILIREKKILRRLRTLRRPRADQNDPLQGTLFPQSARRRKSS